MHMNLPDEVKWIIKQLNMAGFEAFAVGGCVRDMLLNRVPGDWDITTNAKPDEVKKVFTKTVDTGIEHGTVTVIKKGQGYEVTTYRVDGEYEDCRHPKEVTFTTDIKEDLSRRDFTINAMAYNESKGFVDCFGGIEDLNNKIIRCVGDPVERFTEDALRILRAYRFSSQLEFNIAPETVKAAKELAKNIENVSVERIAVELIKLLMGKCPKIISEVYEMGIMDRFYPSKPCLELKILEYLNTTKPEKTARLAALFVGQTEAVTRQVLRNLKLDNDTIKKTSILIRHIEDDVYADKLALRRMLNRYDPQMLDSILEFMEAIAVADGMVNRIKDIHKAKKMLTEILSYGECYALKDLAVNGKDLIELGISPGKAIGDVLNKMMEEVLCDPSKNTKEYLISRIK